MEYEMDAIAAVDAAWGIGRDNGLLHSIPRDMKFFREMTAGKTVVMGRKTLLSMPGGRPLKGRRNIVLSRSKDKYASESFSEDAEGTSLCYVSGIEELFSMLPSDTSDVFVIGGEAIYRLLLPCCDICYVTKNDCGLEADTFYPDLDKDPDFEIISESDRKLHNGIGYRFCTYRRKEATA